MSLRARLTLWNVAVLAILLIAMGGALRARIQTSLEAGIDLELERRSGFLRTAQGRLRELPPRPPGYDPQQHNAPPFPVFDATGKSVFGYRVPADLASLRETVRTRRPCFVTRNNERIYNVPLLLRDGTYVFQESESLEPVQREVTRLTRELLKLFPLGLLAAAFGALFLTQRALRPIETLRLAAASIQASDLSQRLEVKGRDELARLSVTFNEMLARLETAFENQRQFVADASHELKTPLTIIQGAAELGRMDRLATEKSRHFFGRIEEAAERTTRLVQSLLLLARSDSGALVVQKSPVALHPLLEAVQREAEALVPAGAPLALQLDSETLLGDEELLYQLFLNLLVNALRHTPSEGQLTLRVGPTGFTLTDTGTGIAAQHLPHLTERFYRVDSARARKDGGTGLGLAICKSIVEAHDGTLLLESELGKGTTVSVTLG